jgi:hypothetical protein
MAIKSNLVRNNGETGQNFELLRTIYRLWDRENSQ